MKKHKRSVSPLAMVEMEVLEEGREWMRRRMQDRLQRLANEQGAVSPPERQTAQEHQDSPGSDTDERRQGEG